MRKGMKVWWIDPSELHGDEHSSGEYTIVGLQNEEIDDDTIIYLTNDPDAQPTDKSFWDNIVVRGI